MKLLLDAMFDPEIARQLRRRGHDVIAASERTDWAKLLDPEVFALAQREERVVVTENVGDFFELDEQYRAERRTHRGLILTSDHRFHRGAPQHIGRMVLALDRLLRTGEDWPADESPVHWLR